MIIEWIINALITLIKYPISLLNIPDYNIDGFLTIIENTYSLGYYFIRYFISADTRRLITVALSVIALFKVVDLISTFVGFFKKTR